MKNRIPFFDAVSTLTEETRDARRTIPKAILIVACPGCLCSAILGCPPTIDWDHTDLSTKLRFECGSQGFLAKGRPLLESVGGSPMSTEAAHG
ncbi:hypothetical protein NKI86_03190 [Mesorhizobium sp. M0320]|uniref:hypothetical protein n=1 Tax=Mesorhizobium sp. M0320 TaxID=2956936 RepID=UPI003335802E